jgi:hypothetical protein
MMDIPADLLTLEQERELDKVNAFYLQKEAEVCKLDNPLGLFHHPHNLLIVNNVIANLHIAQNSSQDFTRQEKGHQVAPRYFEALVQVYYSRRRFPTIRYGPE